MARKLADIGAAMLFIVLSVGSFLVIASQVAVFTQSEPIGGIFMVIGGVPFVMLVIARQHRIGAIVIWSLLALWTVAGLWMSWGYASAYVRSPEAILPKGVPPIESMVLIAALPYFLLGMTLIYVKTRAYIKQHEQAQVVVPPDQQIS